MTHMHQAMRNPTIAALLLLATPAAAQQPKPATNCTDVQVGTAQSYDCINAQLGNLARNTQRFSADADAPVAASSPSNVVGTFNQSATANRLGRNFGKSVTPYRPAYTPPPAFGGPR
jgi:hypothetical protein